MLLFSTIPKVCKEVFMKKAKKIIAVFVAVLSLALTLAAFVACDKKTVPASGAYKITVLGVDGAPAEGITVQACKIEDDVLTTCYDGVQTGADGIAKIDLTDDADLVEIHIINLPAYLKSDSSPRIHKGDSCTIRLQYKVSSFDSGNGTAQKSGETAFDKASFSPYMATVEGMYKLKFTSADQQIVVGFQAGQYSEKYAIYSVGTVDVAAQTLIYGTDAITFASGDDGYGNATYSDHVSASDKNFRLEFVNDDAKIQAGGYTYFVITLKNAQDVNKDFYIIIEYLEDFVPQA